MPDFLGQIQFKTGAKSHTAHLNEDGWHVPDQPLLSLHLNLVASPREFGPEHGDPVTCAVHAANEVLHGEVTHIRPVPEYPEGVVF